MELFNNLVFEPKNFVPGTFATVSFANNYGVSVITGGYGNETHPYELAVLLGEELNYTSGITEDVIGFLTAEDVDRLMHKVKALPKAGGMP